MRLRPYHVRDLPRVLDFVGECLYGSGLKNYHPGDILHWMSNGQRGENLDKHFWLHEADSELLAFAELPPAKCASFALIIHPSHRNGGLELALLTECEAVMRERIEKESGNKRELSINVATSDRARMSCLSQLGYQPKLSTTLVSIRSLHAPIPAPSLPTGFSLRNVSGEHEAGLLAEVHSCAFGSSWTAEAYLKVMRTPGFESQHELVAVTPNGRFAAFLVYWLDPVSRSGLFEPVGCHPDFRRLGLTKALMLEALKRMAVAGMTAALVGHNAANPAAAKLYTSVGFSKHFETLDYTKSL